MSGKKAGLIKNMILTQTMSSYVGGYLVGFMEGLLAKWKGRCVKKLKTIISC